MKKFAISYGGSRIREFIIEAETAEDALEQARTKKPHIRVSLHARELEIIEFPAGTPARQWIDAMAARRGGDYSAADNIADVRPFLTGNDHHWKREYDPGRGASCHWQHDQGDAWLARRFADRHDFWIEPDDLPLAKPVLGSKTGPFALEREMAVY